jgi:hypothetical protein
MLVNVGLLLLLSGKAEKPIGVSMTDHVAHIYDAVQHRKYNNIVQPISDPLEFHL